MNLRAFNDRLREDASPARKLGPALVFALVAVAWEWTLGHSNLSVDIIKALRERYAVFTQEPVLTWQTFIFLQTFCWKLGVSLLLVVYLILLQTPVAPALALDRKGQIDKRLYRIFLAFSAAIGTSSGLDPLTPAFPLHSFFAEALVWGNIIAVFSMLIVAPIAEEIFFRGFLYPAFNCAFGAAASIVVTSVLFTAAHWRPDVEPSTLGIIFLGSIGLTLTRALSGSTRTSIRLHMVYNFSILAAGFLRYALLGY